MIKLNFTIAFIFLVLSAVQSNQNSDSLYITTFPPQANVEFIKNHQKYITPCKIKMSDSVPIKLKISKSKFHTIDTTISNFNDQELKFYLQPQCPNFIVSIEDTATAYEIPKKLSDSITTHIKEFYKKIPKKNLTFVNNTKNFLSTIPDGRPIFTDSTIDYLIQCQYTVMDLSENIDSTTIAMTFNITICKNNQKKEPYKLSFSFCDFKLKIDSMLNKINNLLKIDKFKCETHCEYIRLISFLGTGVLLQNLYYYWYKKNNKANGNLPDAPEFPVRP